MIDGSDLTDDDPDVIAGMAVLAELRQREQLVTDLNLYNRPKPSASSRT